MKKYLMKLLSLALCLMMIGPAALAQETNYTPGETRLTLLTDALASGKMLTAAMSMGLELDAAALGLGEEEAEQLDSLLAVLEQATLTGGFGLIDGGVRFALEGALADEATGAAVSVDAALNVTIDGLSVESDLIPGRRITATWESLMALAGLGADEIAVFTAAKEQIKTEGVDAIAAQLSDELANELAPMVEKAVQAAIPYALTVIEFASTLPIEVQENLSEEGYPPTAKEYSVVLTAKDAGDLLAKLCDQLAQDADMQQLIDVLLAEAGETATAAQLIDELREIAAEMTDTTMPLIVFLGLDENGVPMYLEGTIQDEASGEFLYGGLYLYEDAELGIVGEIVGGLYDAEGLAIASVYLGGNYLADAADPNAFSAELTFLVAQDDNPLVEFVLASDSTPDAESSLPQYEQNTVYSMYADDGADGVQMMSSTRALYGMTETSGDFVIASTQIDTYVGDVQMTATQTVESVIEPTADGSFTGYTYIDESIPAVGLTNIEFDLVFSGEAYDPATTAALEEITLETLAEGGADALAEDIASTFINDKLFKILDILPSELVSMIMESAQ